MGYRSRIGRRVGGERTGGVGGFLVFGASLWRAESGVLGCCQEQVDFRNVKVVDRRVGAA